MEIICNYELGMLRIAKQRIEVFERKLGKTKTKNLMAIAQTFMPNDEGITIISIDMSAVNVWVLHKIERLEG